MSQIYDCHTHVASLEDLKFYQTYGIIPCLNVSSLAEYEATTQWQADLANSSDNPLPVFISVGCHPWRADRFEQDFENQYEELIKHAHVVGEIGLDSVWADLPMAVQERRFLQSLDLAVKHQKPILLHTKGQEERICQLLQGRQVPIIVHWYSCREHVADYLELGARFTIGPAVLIDPVVQDLVRAVPLERLLLETDGREALEWLMERALSHQEMNDLLATAIKTIASLKQLPVSQVQSQLTRNACQLLMT